MNHFDRKENSKSFTIRLDFLFLFLEVLKIWNLINITWFSLLALMFVPWLFGKLIILYFKRKMEKFSKAGIGNTVPSPAKPKKKG